MLMISRPSSNEKQLNLKLANQFIENRLGNRVLYTRNLMRIEKEIMKDIANKAERIIVRDRHFNFSLQLSAMLGHSLILPAA